MIFISFIIQANRKSIEVRQGHGEFLVGVSKQCAREETQLAQYIQDLVEKYLLTIQLDRKAERALLAVKDEVKP